MLVCLLLKERFIKILTPEKKIIKQNNSFIYQKEVFVIYRKCFTSLNRKEQEESVGCVGNTLQIFYTKCITVEKSARYPVPA